MFKEVADIKTADQLNLPTPTPHYETVVVQPTEIQKRMVESLSERAGKVHGGSVDPRVDNMLKITSDGRKLGLDQRLINPLLPDDPGSKVNACIDNVFRIWQEGSSDKLTQLVFCDISTPKGSEKEKSQKQSPEAADNADAGLAMTCRRWMQMTFWAQAKTPAWLLRAASACMRTSERS